jgi:hypothetical protein
VLLLVLVLGCLPDPRRTQISRLFDTLVEARLALREQPARLEPACGDVSEVGSRLSGEPGLSELRDVWPSLRTASDALVAVCGQATLLEQPFDPTPATLRARARWQNGLEQELQTACDALKRSATALGRRLDC